MELELKELAKSIYHQRCGYDVEKKEREDLSTELSIVAKARTGYTPYEYQLEAAVSLCRKTDLLMSAGTGSGKSLVMVLPCFLNPHITSVILSPLNALQEDQASKFRAWGLKVAVMNGRTLAEDKGLKKDIEKGVYQVIITSPENAISASHLKPFLTTHCTNDLIINVDEAHLIRGWGDGGFRKAWAEIGKIRSYIKAGTPFGAYSATMAHDTMEAVKKSLHIHPTRHTHVQIGNYRRNIFWDVEFLSKSKSAIPELLDYLPHIEQTTNSLPLTLIFVNTRHIGHVVYDIVVKHVPDRLRHQIHLIHSLRGETTKRDVMERVMDEGAGIVITSDITAVGCDFPNCRLVIQLFNPGDIDRCVQRGGRGGRNPAIQCRSLVLSQPLDEGSTPTALAQQAAVDSDSSDSSESSDDETDDETDDEEESNPDDGDQPATKKARKRSGRSDPVMQELLTTKGCLWTVIDKHYGNALPREEPTGGCCYNCKAQLQSQYPPLASPTAAAVQVEPIRISTGYYEPTVIDKEIRVALSDVLFKWRDRVWQADWSIGNVLPEFLMPNKMLKAIVQGNASIHVPEDFSNIKPTWSLWRKYGESALEEMDKKRREIERKWAERHRKLDEARKAETRRKELSRQNERKAKQEEKWRAYQVKLASGIKPRGRAPRQPSPFA